LAFSSTAALPGPAWLISPSSGRREHTFPVITTTNQFAYRQPCLTPNQVSRVGKGSMRKKSKKGLAVSCDVGYVVANGQGSNRKTL
jgi:hypothetical protein